MPSLITAMNFCSLEPLPRAGSALIDKTPVLGIEDGRTRGTTSVVHRRRGPLSSEISALLIQLVFRVIGRTRALLGGL
jgi:hypothetical protein